MARAPPGGRSSPNTWTTAPTQLGVVASWRGPWGRCWWCDDVRVLGVSWVIGVSPVIIHFNGSFHYKPSIWGYPQLWKASYGWICIFLYGGEFMKVFLRRAFQGGFYAEEWWKQLGSKIACPCWTEGWLIFGIQWYHFGSQSFEPYLPNWPSLTIDPPRCTIATWNKLMQNKGRGRLQNGGFFLWVSESQKQEINESSSSTGDNPTKRIDRPVVTYVVTLISATININHHSVSS